MEVVEDLRAGKDVATLDYVALDGPRTRKDYVVLLDGRGEEKLSLERLLRYFRELVLKNPGTILADGAEAVVDELTKVTDLLTGGSDSGGVESDLQNALNYIENLMDAGLLDPLEGEAYLRFLKEELSSIDD